VDSRSDGVTGGDWGCSGVTGGVLGCAGGGKSGWCTHLKAGGSTAGWLASGAIGGFGGDGEDG
jgi:hypothetical protein